MNNQSKQDFAHASYEAIGVSAAQAMEKLAKIPISIHCWQGDDVRGFEGDGDLSGGIAATGNYPGRARTPAELMA
ncbi:MAG: L-rhamnose isomerase, partial [Defluviitaleaceae bacterium]|nr:L-rhamnose isomerase [Defluviitaleaceae bacterium]